MDRFDARVKAAEKLEAMGQLVKVEDYENNVGYSERADVPIEPRISMQWFLKYPCVKEAAEAVASDAIHFRPERWKKTFAHWMEGIQDWCISRQLWWGHQIPVLVPSGKGGRTPRTREPRRLQRRRGPACRDRAARRRGKLGPRRDVLDTWFSSWLWPFATMVDSDADTSETLKKFYPTTDLVTGPTSSSSGSPA